MAGGKSGQQRETGGGFELPKKSESSQAAELGRSRNSARKMANENNRNEDEEVGLELDNIQTSINPGSSGDPSLQATPDGRGGIKLKLKFDVPSAVEGTQENSLNQSQPQRKSTSSHRNSNQGSQTSRANNNSGELAQARQQQMDEQISNSATGQGESTEENPFPLTDAESNPSSKQGTEEGSEGNEDQSEEDQSAFLDQALQEEQVREQQLEQERGKKKQEVQQKRNLGMRVLQQTQGQEMSMKQDQQTSQKMNRVMRIKQKLDQKIKNLRLKKLPLQVALRTLQIAKLFILIARGLLAIVIAILYLTVILAVIGLILKGLDWLLKFIQYGISELINLLEKQIKTIDENIDRATKDREKAVNVIQSIQRQKRSGPRAPAPKFDVPQAA